MDTFNINALAERIEHYLAMAEQVKVDNDAEVIHDFRIAARTVLALEPLLSTTDKTGKWRTQMRNWLKALNHLRDLQVMQERFGEHSHLNTQLEAQIREELQAWEEIRPRIAGKKFRERLYYSLQHFTQYCETYPGYFAATTLSLWWQTLGKVEARFAAIDEDDPATLHRLRVAFKSVRYLTNTLRDLNAIPGDAKEGLKYWHNLLGDLQDRQVAHGWLTQAGADASLPDKQLEEAAQLQATFLRERLEFQQMLLQLDATVTTSLSHMLRTNTGLDG